MLRLAYSSGEGPELAILWPICGGYLRSFTTLPGLRLAKPDQDARLYAVLQEHTMNGNSLALGIALGTGLGAALGAAMDNIAVGIAIGIGVGVALGAAFRSGKDESESDS